MTGVLVRDRKGKDTQRYKGEDPVKIHMKTEAETGVLQLQTKECQGSWNLPESRRETWKGLSFRASRRKQSCQRLDFGLLASRTVTE